MKNRAKTARAIIFVDENKTNFISIKRTKYKDGVENKIYYTFPGGHLEGSETYEQAVIREVYEELGLKVSIIEEFTSIYNEDLNRDETFFICEILEGEIGTGQGPEWTNVNYEKYGKYEIEQININKMDAYNILPIEIKKKIENDYKNA